MDNDLVAIPICEHEKFGRVDQLWVNPAELLFAFGK
jgi:hypothetical protein